MGPCNPALPGAASMAAADAIDEVEGLPQLFLSGLQHVLVMYAGKAAVPLILGSALQFTPKRVIALRLSKIKSRFAVAAGGGLLVLLGFLPKLAAVIAGIPRPV